MRNSSWNPVLRRMPTVVEEEQAAARSELEKRVAELEKRVDGSGAAVETLPAATVQPQVPARESLTDRLARDLRSFGD